MSRLRDDRARRRRYFVSHVVGSGDRFRRALEVDPDHWRWLTVPCSPRRLQFVQGLEELPGKMGFVPHDLVDVEGVWQ